MSAFKRTSYQSVTVQLANSGGLAALTAALAANPAISVDVHREDKYFAAQSNGISIVLTAIGYFIGGIMAVGAVFAALNTMYAAVSAQALLIATLRAIGFNAIAVLAAVFLEALFLAVMGALSGTAIAWLLFNGHTLNMQSGSQSQVVFALHISLQLANLERRLGPRHRLPRGHISRHPGCTSSYCRGLACDMMDSKPAAIAMSRRISGPRASASGSEAP